MNGAGAAVVKTNVINTAGGFCYDSLRFADCAARGS
jgi:hypothetical protein